MAARRGRHQDLQRPPGKQFGGKQLGIGAGRQINEDALAALTGDEEHEVL